MDSKFCKNCGREIVTEANNMEVLSQDYLGDSEMNSSDEEAVKPNKFNDLPTIKDKNKKIIFFRSKNSMIITAIILVLIIGIGVVWKTGVVTTAIANNIYNDLNSSQITYEEAKDKLKALDKLGDVSWAHNKCDKLNNSQRSYLHAVELQDKKDYKTAIFEYNKVIQEDLNYENAKKAIEEIRPLAYDDIVNALNEYLKNENYVDAFKVIEYAEKIFEDDERISSFKADFSKIKERVALEKEIASCDFSTIDGIERYVELKYSSVKNTPFGDWEFTVNTCEYNDKSISLDYSIELFITVDSNKFYDFKYSRDYLESDREKTEAMLKNHMITLAKDLIEKLPNKKFEGQYKVLQDYYNDDGEYVRTISSDRFYEWTNFVYKVNADYASSSPSGFRWKLTEPGAPWYYQTFFYGGAK